MPNGNGESMTFDRIEKLAARATSQVPLDELAELTDAEFERLEMRIRSLLRLWRNEALKRQRPPEPSP